MQWATPQPAVHCKVELVVESGRFSKQRPKGQTTKARRSHESDDSDHDRVWETLNPKMNGQEQFQLEQNAEDPKLSKPSDDTDS